MQDLMKGKRGLIMGIANDHSIAWGIAKTLAAQGAEMAFTYQGEALAGVSLYFDDIAPIASNSTDSVQSSSSQPPANTTSCLPIWIVS